MPHLADRLFGGLYCIAMTTVATAYLFFPFLLSGSMLGRGGCLGVILSTVTVLRSAAWKRHRVCPIQPVRIWLYGCGRRVKHGWGAASQHHAALTAEKRGSEI